MKYYYFNNLLFIVQTYLKINNVIINKINFFMFLASLNNSSIEKLSPIQKPTEENDNTDDDVKSDLKSNKNESSLEDIETDENVSCGNDSLLSSDLSVS